MSDALQTLQTLRTAVQDGRGDALVLAVLEEIHPDGNARDDQAPAPASAEE